MAAPEIPAAISVSAFSLDMARPMVKWSRVWRASGSSGAICPDQEIIILIGKLIQWIRRSITRAQETHRSHAGSAPAGTAASRRLDAQGDEREERNPLLDAVEDRARPPDAELRQAAAAQSAARHAHVRAVRRRQRRA